MGQAQQPTQFRLQFQQVLSHIEILKRGKIPSEIQQELFVCQKEELDNLVTSVCRKGFKVRVKLNYKNILSNSGFTVLYNYYLRENCIEIELNINERRISQIDYEQLERLKTKSFVEIHEVDFTTLYIPFDHLVNFTEFYNLEDKFFVLIDDSVLNLIQTFSIINNQLSSIMNNQLIPSIIEKLIPSIIEKLLSFPTIITLYINYIPSLIRGILFYPKKFAIEEIKFTSLINTNLQDGRIFTEISLSDSMPNYHFFLQWKKLYQNKVNSFHLFIYYTLIELLALGLTQDEESLHDDWHIFLTRGLYDPRLLLLISSYF